MLFQRYYRFSWSRLLGIALCLAGLHDFRTRKNGQASERVCMRPGCERKEKLYALKGSGLIIYNKKRVHNHNFIKTIKAVKE